MLQDKQTIEQAPEGVRTRARDAARRTFQSLGQRNFRNLWFSMLLQSAGQHMFTIALGYYVYDLTGSEATLGMVIAATGLPGLVLSLYGGALGDRMEKKTILQVCQAAAALLGVIVAVAIQAGVVTWGHLVLVALVYGSIVTLFWPVRQALIPQLVPRELVMNAVALNSMALGLMTMVGPALGGVIIAILGVDSLFYLIAALHLAAAILVARLPRQREPRPEQQPPILADILAGLRYIRGNVVVLTLLLLGFAQMTMMVPIRFVMPIFARDVFDTGPEGLGLLMGAMGVGSLGGSLFMASLRSVHRRGLILGLSGLASGVLVLAFSLAGEVLPLLIVGLVFLALMGLVQSGRMAMQNALVMEYVDPNYRGRVMSITALSWSAMPVGVLPLSILMAQIGAPAAMGIIALIFIVVSFAAIALSPRLRTLE